MELARTTKTELNNSSEEMAAYDPDGKAIPADEVELYSNLTWDDGIIAKAFRYSNEHSATIDPKRSLYDFFEEQTKSLFTEYDATQAERKREVFLQMAWVWSCYIGSPVTRQSLKFFWLEECIEGENLFVTGTYRKILDAVARPAQDGARIHLLTEVTEIHARSSEGAQSEAERYQHPVTAITPGGNYQFDELVVTTPLGWLKQNKGTFRPPLPDRLAAAIDNISYGHLDKVYITFPAAFWNGPTNGTQAEDKAGMPGQETSSTHGTTKSRFAGFIRFLCPNYALSTNPQSWQMDCMNLASTDDGISHPTLLFYIQGDVSKHIGKLITDASSEGERDAKLLEFFSPYYSRLPYYNATSLDCKPKAVFATAWVNDKFAGNGSYSNFQVGLEKGNEDIEVMRHGMPERGIWLAGEHTAPFVALGTSTGAYWSGQYVAERIMRAYAEDIET